AQLMLREPARLPADSGSGADTVGALYSHRLERHIPPMAHRPDQKTEAQKAPAKPTRAKAHRPDVQPIGPALAELLNPAIGKGEAGIGSGTSLQPAPGKSKEP